MGRQLVGQPGDALGRVVEHRGGDPGLFDHAVAVEDRRHPPQVDLARPHGAAAHHHAGVGGVVGDGVEDLARGFRLRIDLLDARIDDLQRRDHPLGGLEHVEQGAARSLQRLAEDERQLHLDPRHDEALEGDIAALLEEHVVEQGAIVRFADIRRDLHGARGQADLVALEHAPVGDLALDPGALDGVGVLDGDVRVVEGELPYLLARAFGGVEAVGGVLDQAGIEHGRGLSVQRGLTTAAGVRRTRPAPRAMRMASRYRARLALWVVSRIQPIR